MGFGVRDVPCACEYAVFCNCVFPLVCAGEVAASPKVKTRAHFEVDAVVPGRGALIVSTYVYSEFADDVGGEVGVFRVPLEGRGSFDRAAPMRRKFVLSQLTRAPEQRSKMELSFLKAGSWRKLRKMASRASA